LYRLKGSEVFSIGNISSLLHNCALKLNHGVLFIMNPIPDILSSQNSVNFLANISIRSRIIYWIIIGSIICAIAILPFVYVDVSVKSRGYFQSEIEKQILVTPFQGKIIFSCVQNGRRILKGDTILIIDQETVQAQKSALIERIAENDGSISDLEKLTEARFLTDNFECQELITKRYQAELANFRNLLSIQIQKFHKKQKEHERIKYLYSQELISESDFENSLFNLNYEKENLDQVFLSHRFSWNDDLASRKNERVILNADYKYCSEELINKTLIAPVAGEIIQSSDIQVGSIVSQGQNIAEISPDGELVAMCVVTPCDIGLIQEGQRVKLQIDAFNYREWGMLNGKISDISDDIIVENGSTAYFRIKCKPEGIIVSLKNGQKAIVKKGMSLTARIVVTRRSIFNLLFDKADKWFNPYKIEN
jgi:multidrug resistance efflux pump